MFHGSIVALVTPMLTNQQIDYESFSRLVEWHVAHKTDALVIIGSTGEAASLRPEERQKLIRLAVSIARARLPIIVGTGQQSTHATIELTRQAMECGADACLIVTPFYNKPTQEGLYQHFKTVAQNVPIPQILYNVPSRTACDLKPETVIRLTEISNIVGIKEATGDLSRVGMILNQCHDHFDLFSGDDLTAADFMLLGGKGVISVIGNLLPEKNHDLVVAALSGDKKKAWALQQELGDLNRALYVETNPIPLKWAMAESGLIQPGIRLPLTPLSAIHHDLLRKHLAKFREAGNFN